jgi:hypothetical protein
MYDFSPYIRENSEFFTKLAATKSDKKKNDLLKGASAEQILGLVEICANILKFNFRLNRRQRRRLALYADYYRAIARSRSERTARHRLQQGSGIALGAILAPILTVLAEQLLQKVVAK